MKIFGVLLYLIGTVVSANEAKCLTDIMWAEARGESVEGLIAVGEAAVRRAKNQKEKICETKGLVKRNPPIYLKPKLNSLALEIIKKPNTILKKSDSWNTGTIPRQPGKIERKIGKHIFYEMRRTQ